MENLPRNPPAQRPASHMLDDLLSLLADLDVNIDQKSTSKSNGSAPTTSQDFSDSNHGNRSVNDRPSTLEPTPDRENSSLPKVSNLITAHRQSLLKSLSLPIAPLSNSAPEKSVIPPEYQPPSKSNDSEINPRIDSSSLETAPPNNSEDNSSSIDNHQTNNSENIHNETNNHNHQINNLGITDVLTPKYITLTASEISIPKPQDFLQSEINTSRIDIPRLDNPKLDNPKSTNSPDSINSSSISNSTNGSSNSTINASKNGHSQAPQPVANDAKDTSTNLGLLRDLVLSSPPAKNSVEVITIPERFSEPSLAIFETLPEVITAPPLEPLLELVSESGQELKVNEDPLDILQRLLVNPDVYDAQKLLQNLEVSLKKLESQIYEPEKLIELLLPMIADLLSLKISQSKEEVVKAITPIIDEVIQHRIEQDRVAMSGAIAPIISEAISKQISDSPEEIANAIGPTMGKAIQEQIRLEKDSMVDALYPIIGTTISKYMGEAIANINRQVETAFSAEGLKRKIQAKIQGVSEAELIFRQALPFTVLAVFLIHKSSGLLIADAQPPEEQQLEADMIAGMLTAIRSFANDCMTSGNNSSELNQIDYSDSKIVLEVAGYCYLALVIRGQMTEGFVKKFRRSMATIVRIYNRPIMNFEGDRSTIPEEVNTLIEDMIIYNDPDIKPTSRYPLTLGFVILAVISIVAIPLGIYQYRQSINNQIAQQVTTALDKTPELSVYRLEAQVIDDKVKLIGKVPNSVLQKKAETIAQQVETNLAIDNQIISVDIPVDTNFTLAEIQRTTMILNRNPGIVISSRYQAGVLEIIGIAKDGQSKNNVTKVMQNIPGIKLLSNQIQLKDISQEGILRRIYFEAGSVALPSASLSQITEIKNLLTLSSNFRLRMIGYADNIGDPLDNKGLATARAISVQQILLEQGIEQERLEIRGSGSIKQIPEASELWQSRFVEFELIAPNIQN